MASSHKDFKYQASQNRDRQVSGVCEAKTQESTKDHQLTGEGIDPRIFLVVGREEREGRMGGQG
jgi:hypothetical protein